MISMSTHDFLLLFTDKGRVYRLKGYNVPSGSRTSKGIPIVNLMTLEKGEKVNVLVAVPKDDESETLLFVTKNGIVKRTSVSEFENINRNFTLHLSGTPFKAVASGKFSDDQIYNWIYADEQEAKVDWPIESEENNPYEKLPRLSLFSYQMSQMITDEVNKDRKSVV